MLTDFKKFIMRGNVMDLAVGVIIAGAFGKIVSSLVADVIMPFVGMMTGGVNFTDLAVVLKEADGETPAVLMKYGVFFQNIFDFVVIGFVIFMMVRAITSMQKKEEAAAPAAPPKDIVLLEEIRDLLKK